MDSTTVQHDQPLQEDHIKRLYNLIDEWKKELHHLSQRIQHVKEHFSKSAVAVEADTSNEVNANRLKDILENIQNNWPTMDLNCDILERQQTAIARLIIEQDNLVKRRWKNSEQTLVGEIDELTRQKEYCQKQIDTLKGSNMLLDEHMRFSEEYLKAEVTKRGKLIEVLDERLRKLREAARYQFDGSNFDEYRKRMQMWEEDDIKLGRKCDKIKQEFSLNNGRLLMNTLMWAFTAFANLPEDCINKPDFNKFLKSMKVEAAKIRKEVLLGHAYSVKETIEQIQEYTNQRPGNCNHADEFKEIVSTLQNAIQGDYTGIQTDYIFTDEEATRVTQNQKSKACTLL